MNDKELLELAAHWEKQKDKFLASIAITQAELHEARIAFEGE